jgi:2,3-dihydroxybiphenyl 1,2-dioxygenase
MSVVSNLGYVVFGVSELQRWESFAVDVLGMQLASRSTGALAFRMDDYCQRLVLETNPIDDIVAAGWEFESETKLAAFVDQSQAKGVILEPMTSELARRRKVEGGYSCSDPVMPYVHEFYFCPEMPPLNSPFVSKHLKSSFVTGPLGVGHILPVTRDLTKSMNFLVDVLGLRVSDYIREEVGPGFVIDATFLHTKTGRHHSIGIAQAELPKILNHFMVQVADMDDVGLAYDRAVRAGCHFALEIGHHPNDQMTSFYVRSPSGFNIEYGFGGIVIDDATWKVRRYSQLSDWGHRRNVSPAEHPRNV